MVYRHSLITRVTHATFGISFFALALSGAQMYFHRHWLPFNVGSAHQYFALAMLASGIVYIASAIRSGEIGSWNDGYNSLQKLAYTAVLLFIAPLIAATGLALWKHSPLQPPMAAIFGRKTAAVWHVGFAIELVLFFLGHVAMVATTGLRNNVRSMITGWYAVPAREAKQEGRQHGTVSV